jgi:PAS domain S-box-containing protein
MAKFNGVTILRGLLPRWNPFFKDKPVFPQIPNASPDPILITNPKREIYYVNPAWEQLTGYTFEEVKGKNPRFLNSGKTPKSLYTRLWKSLLQGKPFSTDAIHDRRKDGTEYQIHSTFFPIKSKNKNIYYVQVMYDITANNIYQKALQESEEKLQLIINNTNGHAIYMLDKYGKIVSWNRGAERLLGYTSHEVLGKPFSMFFTVDEIKQKKPQRVIAIATKKGRNEDKGVRLKKDGTLLWTDTVLCAVRGKRGALKGFVEITRDITKQRAVDQQRDAFIGIASHELKTPLTTLSAYTQILEKRLKGDKKNEYFVKNIKLQTTRLLGLIDDLLNVSRIDSGKLELNLQAFDLNQLVNKIIVDFQYATETHKILQKGTIKKNVVGDENRIEQVVINLLTNAIKYSPNAKEIIVHLSSDNNHAIIGIQDFGLGIVKEDHHNIFKRFFRTKKKESGVSGFGLGLYISKEIIKRHKGKIWLVSKQGLGSTFFFSLPLLS